VYQTNADSKSERFSEAITKLGLTQVDVAQATKYSQPYISQLMKGTRNLTFKILQRIANHYPINAVWVMTGDGEMLLTPKDLVSETAAEYRKTDPFDILRDRLDLYEQRISDLEREVALLKDRVGDG
jgi:transcriptional regulator with XRE-family HTH domain